ncbi:MAG: histidinol dehydrogenase, partial [Gammaproteobacteria bacterium]|nr:histidinol dehydrogenase [Gammaproteobacteria bacterium]
EEVRLNGDRALFELTNRYDDVSIQNIRVSDNEINAAKKKLPSEALKAINLAIQNVKKFHEQQIPKTIDIETMPGVRCERISQPLDAVGLYVPAGTAPLPSAAIMLGVPAKIAGCPRTILCTPPQSDGTAHPAVLLAASLSGVDEIYKIGGAQAVAAMAYGTESLIKVQKIFGPGNAWVTAAKSIVSSDPNGSAIDLPAGPSELLVIADKFASAEFVAADLLSQAEHGVDSHVLLVTDNLDLAISVQKEIDNQLLSLSRSNIASATLRNSNIVISKDIKSAVQISNLYAPEHLIIQTKNPRILLEEIRNSGSVFVGKWAPESVGDYCSGTNHVLPTYGYANAYSGLGVEQFMRQMTVQELSKDGLINLSDAVICLANIEGLDAHAAAVIRRLKASK